MLNLRQQHESFNLGEQRDLGDRVSGGVGGGFYSCAQGHRVSNPSTAALISFSVNAAVLVPYIIYHYPAEKILQSANLFFFLSGIIQPAIVRVMFYVGIVRLGVCRAGPIRGTSPFFSWRLPFLSFKNDRS